MTRFGLEERWLSRVVGALEKAGVARAVIFGSRARGDFKEHSDIDLAVWAPHLTTAGFSRLRWDLDDLPLVFRIDVLRADQPLDPRIASRIERDGVDILPTAAKDA